MKRGKWLWLVIAVLSPLARNPAAAQTALPPVVEFNRDIRPILSDNCFACHGPDKNQRKADLRLDTEEGAFAARDDGSPVIVRGKPEQSALYRRITAAEGGEKKGRMPPAKFGKRLSAPQVELIRRWIEQGATWQKHWSRLAAVRPELPAVGDRAWPINAVDRFILARLDQEELKPSPTAD